MHGDTFAFGVGRIARVLSGIRWPCVLDEQERGCRVTFFGYDRDATARRIVADNLQKGRGKERGKSGGARRRLRVGNGKHIAGSLVRWLAATLAVID